jgi:hypothetical protein
VPYIFSDALSYDSFSDVESEDDKNFFRVYSRPFETECPTADEVPAVSTRLGMAEETASSLDCCASTTKHSEGA